MHPWTGRYNLTTTFPKCPPLSFTTAHIPHHLPPHCSDTPPTSCHDASFVSLKAPLQTPGKHSGQSEIQEEDVAGNPHHFQLLHRSEITGSLGFCQSL